MTHAELIKRLRDYCDEQDYYDPDNIEYRSFIREAADAIESLSNSCPANLSKPVVSGQLEPPLSEGEQ